MVPFIISLRQARSSYSFLMILCLFSHLFISTYGWGGGQNYRSDRALTGRLSRSWGFSMLSPIFSLFGLTPPSTQPATNYQAISTTAASLQQLSDDSTVQFNFQPIKPYNEEVYANDEAALDSRLKPAEVSLVSQPHVQKQMPTGEQAVEIGCDAYRYDRSPVCPDGEEGYFRVGSSCYFVSSASSLVEKTKTYTLKQAQTKCENLNDNTGQTLGRWHLLAINDHNEETYVAPLLNIVAKGDDNKGQLLWVSQMAPVPTVDDALALGSPFVYTTNCVGPVNVDKTSAHAPEALAELLSKPAGCNILTTRDSDNIAGLESACENSRLAYICELELDGDRAHFSVPTWQQPSVSAAPATNNFIEQNAVESDLRRPTTVRLGARRNLRQSTHGAKSRKLNIKP